jgi:hypothetical protein
MEFSEIYKRILGGLQENHDSKHKMFWHGFIVALHDTHQITHEKYIILRDTIEIWGTHFDNK